MITKTIDDNSLIGYGGYGCIFYPDTSCEGKPRSIGKKKKKYNISKIQVYGEGAKNEIFLGHIIRSIPNYKKHFMPVLTTCKKIGWDNIHEKTKNKCNALLKKKHQYNHVIVTKTRYIKHHSLFSLLSKKYSKEELYKTLLYYGGELLKSIEILKEYNFASGGFES